MKNTIVLSILIAFSCGVPKKRIKTTYATYDHFHSYVRGGDNYWKFSAGGKEYHILGWKPYGKIKGDKYVIFYDSLHPDTRYYIAQSMPLFIKGEKTSITTGIIEDDDECFYPNRPKRKSQSVGYTYIVNNQKYFNYQGIPSKTDSICVKKGDKFEVEYWVENPKRSIIHLNKKIKQ